MPAHTRNEVLVVVPPNSNTVIEGQTATVTAPHEHSDWSDFLSLGALSLVSALERNPDVTPWYVDGTVIDFEDVLSYVQAHASRILAVCIGTLTANYEAGLTLLRAAKEADPRIATVIGNDHFTALPEECMHGAGCIDFGFVGNEVVGPFCAAVADLAAGRPLGRHAGLVTRRNGSLATVPQQPEPVFQDYDYGLVDRLFDHTRTYTKQFEARVARRVKELVGREVRAGVPVELGRGCVKFASDDACSFCSIQYGGMWKNQLTAEGAWAAIERAWKAEYDYLYVTADELPLTFGPLLLAMSRRRPAWWTALRSEDRPLLVGYARADGIADPRKTSLLLELGIGQVMIGMDAGAAASLSAMNKPLRSGHSDQLRRAERLYESNWRAIAVARDQGILIRAGFVIGHIGLTPELLEENVDRIRAILSEGRDVISALDVEVLQPTPGSLDWTYLTSPPAARAAAERLGLEIGDAHALQRAAERWAGRDVVLPEHAMRDFAAALMPGVGFDELADARSAVRDAGKALGIVIGE